MDAVDELAEPWMSRVEQMPANMAVHAPLRRGAHRERIPIPSTIVENSAVRCFDCLCVDGLRFQR